MQGKREKPDPTLKDAQDETEMVIFDAVDNLLKTTNTDPQEVCARWPAPAAIPHLKLPGWAPDGARASRGARRRACKSRRGAGVRGTRAFWLGAAGAQALRAGARTWRPHGAVGPGVQAVRARTRPGRRPPAGSRPPAPGPDAARARARSRRSTS